MYIEEYNPNYAPQTDKWYSYRFYDEEKDIEFFVMDEPEGLHMEEGKKYILKEAVYGLPYYDAEAIGVVKMWARLDDHTVIIAFTFLDDEDEWGHLNANGSNSGIPEDGTDVMTVEDYIASHSKK